MSRGFQVLEEIWDLLTTLRSVLWNCVFINRSMQTASGLSRVVPGGWPGQSLRAPVLLALAMTPNRSHGLSCQERTVDGP